MSDNLLYFGDNPKARKTGKCPAFPVTTLNREV